MGKGIVPIAGGWGELLEYAREPVGPSLMVFLGSGLGVKADEARKAGVHVIGGSKFCDRAEKDRAFGESLAEEMGALIPETRDFSTISDAIDYASELGDQATYFKSHRYLSADATYGAKDGADLAEYLKHVRARYGNHIRCEVQDKIEGVAVSTEAWFNGREFILSHSGSIEKKKFMNGCIGPSTGCSLNAVWFYEGDSQIGMKLGFDRLAAILRQHEAPPGVYDANAIIDDDGDPHFLEWCDRYGWDTEATGMKLFGDYSRFLWHLATGQGDPGPVSGPDTIAYSVRLSVPPYPAEDVRAEDKASPIGTPIRGVDGLHAGSFVAYQLMATNEGLAVAAPEAIVGLSVAVGRKVSVLEKQALAFVKDEMRVPGLQYRTDGAAVINEDAKNVRKNGISDLPSGLEA